MSNLKNTYTLSIIQKTHQFANFNLQFHTHTQGICWSTRQNIRYVVQAPRSATLDTGRPTINLSEESYFAVNGYGCTNLPTKIMTPPSKGHGASSHRMADGRTAEEKSRCFVAHNNIGNKTNAYLSLSHAPPIGVFFIIPCSIRTKRTTTTRMTSRHERRY